MLLCIIFILFFVEIVSVDQLHIDVNISENVWSPTFISEKHPLVYFKRGNPQKNHFLDAIHSSAIEIPLSVFIEEHHRSEKLFLSKATNRAIIGGYFNFHGVAQLFSSYSCVIDVIEPMERIQSCIEDYQGHLANASTKVYPKSIDHSCINDLPFKTIQELYPHCSTTSYLQHIVYGKTASSENISEVMFSHLWNEYLHNLLKCTPILSTIPESAEWALARYPQVIWSSMNVKSKNGNKQHNNKYARRRQLNTDRSYRRLHATRDEARKTMTTAICAPISTKLQEMILKSWPGVAVELSVYKETVRKVMALLRGTNAVTGARDPIADYDWKHAHNQLWNAFVPLYHERSLECWHKWAYYHDYHVKAPKNKHHVPVLFIHIGKACGGTVRETLRQSNIRYEEMQMSQVRPDHIARADKIIITLRDPVNRTLSAFNWDHPICGIDPHKESKGELFYQCFDTAVEYVRALGEEEEEEEEEKGTITTASSSSSSSSSKSSSSSSTDAIIRTGSAAPSSSRSLSSDRVSPACRKAALRGVHHILHDICAGVGGVRDLLRRRQKDLFVVEAESCESDTRTTLSHLLNHKKNTNDISIPHTHKYHAAEKSYCSKHWHAVSSLPPGPLYDSLRSHLESVGEYDIYNEIRAMGINKQQT